MRRRKNRKGSVMIASLCIFLLVATFALIISQLSLNNLKQAKLQEENMHAYYLAYSACEVTYVALVEQNKSNWKNFVSSLSTTPKAEHKLYFTTTGSTESGYKSVEMKQLREHEDVKLQITKVPDPPKSYESEFKGWLKISAVGRTFVNGRFSGEKMKNLYVHPDNYSNHFWR